MNEKITLQIDTAGELRAFAKDINSGRYHGQPDLTVKLTADIDLGGLDKWLSLIHIFKRRSGKILRRTEK